MTVVSLVFRQAEDGALVAPPSCGLLTIPDFLAHVQRLAFAGGPVVVDLSEVVDVDMAAFRSLVWARRYCARRSVRFAVVEPARGVFPQPQEALLRELLPVFPDRASAARGGRATSSGEASLPSQRSSAEETCAVAGCDDAVHAGGRCSRHHLRRLRYRTARDQQR